MAKQTIDLSILNFDFNTLFTKIEELEAVESAVEQNELEILRVLIERLQRISRHIAEPIQISRQYTTTSQGILYEKESHLDVAGVLLFNTFYKESSDEFSGDFCGHQLFLDVQGKFVELTRSGHWSCWQNSTSEWSVEVRYMSLEEVSEEYHLAPIVENIAEASKKAVNKAEEKKKELQHQLEQLEAVKKILASA